MKVKDYFIPTMYRRLLVPSLLSSLGFAFADMADAFVVGQKTGETGLATISLCLPLFMAINLFMDGFGIGGSIHFSQLLGKGKKEEAIDCFNRIWNIVLVIGLFIGILTNIFTSQVLFVLGADKTDIMLYKACENYLRVIAFGAPLLMLNIVFFNFLRNDNHEKRAATGFLIGNATDIILNFVLVLGFDLGTRGAALSTVIGSFVAIIIYLPGFFKNKTSVLKFKLTKPCFKETNYCFSNGFSTSVQYIFQFIMLIVINNLLMKLEGKSGVAVFDLVYNMSFFILYLVNAAGEAAQPLVSTFSGENSSEDCHTVLKLLKNSSFYISTAVALVLFVFSRNIAIIFGISRDILPLASFAIRVYCIGYLFTTLNIIYEKYYQAKENFALAFFISVMKRFAVMLVTVIVLYFMGIKAIWFMFPVTEFISLILFYIYRKKTFKNTSSFPEERILRITIKNDNNDIKVLLDEVSAFCEKWEANVKQQYYVNLVIEELATSILRNAIKDDENGRIRITLLAMENGEFKLHVLDNAITYNPFQASENSADDEFNIDAVSIGLVKSKAKTFMYRQCSGFNSLVVSI